jgi:hypothetical protein
MKALRLLSLRESGSLNKVKKYIFHGKPLTAFVVSARKKRE